MARRENEDALHPTPPRFHGNGSPGARFPRLGWEALAPLPARPMGDFLKDNWIWILAPMVLVLVAVLSLLLLGGEEGDAGFIYNLW